MTMKGSHETSRGARPVAAALVGVLVALVVGVAAYNAGVSHGLAQQMVATGTSAPYGYPGPRPWGFGFGFFFPLLFSFLLLRLVLWGGFGHRRWHRGYGYACGGPSDVPPAFDEWHRRAHERDAKDPAATGV
jgi:hypothetical protein